MAQQVDFNERRAASRFTMRLPLTLLSDGRNISAFTKDVSARGVLFFVTTEDSNVLKRELDFIIEFPPEITLCHTMKVRCKGRVLRTRKVALHETAVAAEIFRYSFMSTDEQAKTTAN